MSVPGDLQSTLEELLLSGYDVSSLLQVAGGGVSIGASAPGLDLLQAHASSGLGASMGWAPSGVAQDQASLYQGVAQTLAATLEEHRLQQVQVATALQQLQALQQQQELANYQQQLNALQHVPRGGAFQRSRTTDLESLGRGTLDLNANLAASLEQQHQLAAMQAQGGQMAARHRITGVVNQHSMPVRSFSSEHLIAGRRGPPAHLLPAQGPQAGGMARRPPLRQPSGLGPPGTAGPPAGGRSSHNNRPADNGRRARYAATAKAPSWASEDWHPMKIAMAGGSSTSGTGVFLPHLSNSSSPSPPGAGALSTCSPTMPAPSTSAPGFDPHCIAEEVGQADGPTPAPARMASAAGTPPARMAHLMHGVGAGGPNTHSHPHAHLLVAGKVGSPARHTANGLVHAHSPNSTAESGWVDCPASRRSIDHLSRGSTMTDCNSSDAHALPHAPYLGEAGLRGFAGGLGQGVGVGVLAGMGGEHEEQQHGGKGELEECDFASLAKELTDLMNRQVIS